MVAAVPVRAPAVVVAAAILVAMHVLKSLLVVTALAILRKDMVEVQSMQVPCVGPTWPTTSVPNGVCIQK